MRLASWFAAAAAILAAAPGVAAGQASPVLRVGAIAGPISLDGRLLEADWLGADSIAELTQIEPTEGATPTGRTVVRVLASSKELIVGVVAWLGAGQPIVSFSKARDVELTQEDHVRLVIDPFRDGRSGYLFTVNPTGARFDALVANQGEGQNANWDAIWEAATFVNDSAWSVEIRIPIKSLSFPAGESSWSFNVQRRVQSALETDRWAAPQRDYKFGQTTRAGVLTGLPRFDLGTGLTVRPAVTGGAGHEGPGADLDATADGSLDLEQRLSTNLLGSVTVNTDFAETEVDTRRTNLTRFPLFFPEKRTFFLEGADVFEFGLGLGSEVLPFFSRRVGLLKTREVPIRLGGKLNGQIGSSRVGAIVTRTGEVGGLTPAATLGAFRWRQNVLRESSIGAMLTAGSPSGGGGWTVGADAIYRTSRLGGNKNFLVGPWFLAAGGGASSGDRVAYGAKIDYPNDLVDIGFTWKRIGKDFDPALGFVPRRGAHLLHLGATISPRPQRFGIRQAFFENFFTLATDLDGRWESYRWFTAPINYRLESGDRIEVNFVPQGERPTAPFEIADSVVVDTGAYRYTRYRLEVETAARRRISGQVSWWFGGFYGGRLHQLELRGAWKPSASFALEVNVERNVGRDVGRQHDGDFATTLVGTRLRFNVSPQLQINSFIQYDSESKDLGTNSRLRWTATPVTEVFLVYNHNLRRSLVDRLDRWSFVSNQFLAKVQHAFRY
jgi:hypothetical protein